MGQQGEKDCLLGVGVWRHVSGIVSEAGAAEPAEDILAGEVHIVVFEFVAHGDAVVLVVVVFEAFGGGGCEGLRERIQRRGNGFHHLLHSQCSLAKEHLPTREIMHNHYNRPIAEELVPSRVQFCCPTPE